MNFNKLVTISGNGHSSQCVELNLLVASLSFFIEDSSLNNKKGQVHFNCFNKLVFTLKFNTDTSKYKLIRHVYLFGKQVPYDCSL